MVGVVVMLVIKQNYAGPDGRLIQIELWYVGNAVKQDTHSVIAYIDSRKTVKGALLLVILI